MPGSVVEKKHPAAIISPLAGRPAPKEIFEPSPVDRAGCSRQDISEQQLD